MSFFTLGGYSRNIDEGIRGIGGSIIMPSMKPAGFLEDHKDLDSVEYYHRRLLDPQIYLAHLDASRCEKRCAYLASYPWFDIGTLQRKKSAGYKATQRWHTKARKSIAFSWPGRALADDQIDRAIRETFDFKKKSDVKRSSFRRRLR
jgi:hypothetical protein